MADVFLSYNRGDQAQAKLFAEAFAHQGLSVWWDSAIRAGETYDATTESALRAARAVVVLWSPRSVASHWVRSEASVGREMGRLAPAKIEDCELPVMFRLLQTADLQQWKGAADDPAWRAFVGDVRRLVESTPAKQPQPTLPDSAVVTPRSATGGPPATASIQTPSVARRVALAGIAAACVAAAGTAAGRFAPKRKPAASTSSPVAASPPMLAALPFAALTKGADDIAFADGLHEDLLSRLAKIGGMRVIARTSVLGFANTDKRASEIAKELGVGSLLTGSVQRAGGQVRVSVQLIDGKSETQVWAESFDRPLTTENLFAIQREITEAIANATGAVLTAREMQSAFIGGTKNLDAYQAYARGTLIRRSANWVQADPWRQSRAAFEDAVRLDPQFAAAYAFLAMSILGEYWVLDRSDQSLRAAAVAALDRARALAPNSAETSIAEAALRYYGNSDFKAAEAAIDETLAAAPNSSDASYLKAMIVRRLGRFSETVDDLQKVLSLDPFRFDANFEFVTTLIRTGAFADADRRVKAPARPEWREHPLWIFARSSWLATVGRPGAAWAGVRTLAKTADVLPYNLVALWAVQSRDPEAVSEMLTTFPKARRSSKSNPFLYDVVRAYAMHALGKIEEARTLVRPIWETGALSEKMKGGSAWESGRIFTIADIPGILGDLEGVRAAAAGFLTSGAPDKWQEPNSRASLATAFARAGDAESAMAHLEAAEKILGPCVFLQYSIHPPFDGLHAQPRYLAMKARYEAWANKQEPWSAD